MPKFESGATTYYHPDHLSNRLVGPIPAGTSSRKWATFPFGEIWYNASAQAGYSPVYERDAESGNDYAMARFYINPVARFSSPDPLAGSIAYPQSLNRYAYVFNNPLGLIDPSGLTTCDANGKNCYDSVTVNGDTGVVSWADGGVFGNGSGHFAPLLDQTGGGGTSARFQCAIKFGQNHSLAAGIGAIFGDSVGNNFVTQLLLGNTASSLVKIGTDIFDGTAPDARQVASMALKGVGQGIPNLPGGLPVTGPVAPLRNAAAGAAISAGYNVVAGVGQETLELGISGSNVATTAAPLLQTTVQSIVSNALLAKFGVDAATFAYGYFVACKPKP